MASFRVLAFNHEGRPLQFDTWLDDLQLYLLSDYRDSVSLFDHTSSAAPTPPATADSATRSQWLTRDAATRSAICNHLPLAECAHFGQHRTAQTLYDAVVGRYSSPATAALGRLLLPYLFPELSAFATVEDLVSHLRASDACYRAAAPTEDHFLSLDPTFLTVDLLEQHLLAAETSAVSVGASRGTLRTPFFEGCSPSPLSPSYASAAAVDVLSTKYVGAASASAKRRSSKGKGGRGGGGGSSGGSGGSGGGGSSRSGGGSGDVGGGSGGSGGSGGRGSGGSGGGRTGAQRGGSGGGHQQRQQRRSEKPHTQHRYFSRLDDAWRAEFGDEVERPQWAELLRSGVAIFDLEYDANLSTMYALFVSAEGDCYQCLPPDPGIAAAALGASESSLPRTAPAEDLHTFTMDSGASRSFFRDSTTLTPLPAPVLVRLTPPRDRSLPVPPLSSRVRQFRPAHWSSLYTLATKPPQVAASAQVSASGQVAASCSCRLLSHQTLLWHHRLGHPSLPRLRDMHSRLLVSGLPRSLPPLPPSPAPPCLLCVKGRQRAAPHSSSFPPKTAPLQTLHMDVKGEVPDVLIPWIRAVRLQLRERFRQNLPFLHLHSDRGGDFSSDLLRDFFHGEGILQSFTLPESPQQNGIAERRIGLIMEPRVPLPETLHALRWTGKVGDASVFRVWGSRAFVRDTSADKLSARAIPCVFLGFSPYAPGWQFYHPTSRRVFPSQDVTFDESVPFYRLFPYRSAPPPPPPLFLAPGPPPVDPLPPKGPAPSVVSQVDPLAGTAPVEVAVGSGAARGATSGGATSGGAELGGAESEGAGSGGEEPAGAEPVGVEPRGAEPEGVEPGGAELEGEESGGAEPRGAASSGGPAGASPRLGTGAAGTGGVGGARAGDPTEPGAARAGGDGVALALEALELEKLEFEALVREALELEELELLTLEALYGHDRTSRVLRSRPPPVPITHAMALRPSSVALHVPHPPPPESSLPEVPDPESDRARAANPTVSRLLATAVTDPSFESTAASTLVAELLDFAAACRLDYATALVAESESSSPLAVGGECALGTDVLEDRQGDFECLAAAVPCFASVLLAPEGDPDAPDIPTPRSYAEAIMVPPSQANIVDGMWIFSVKRPLGSPPAFKARYVARGFSQRQGVVYLHEEIWLRRPPGFTESFLAGTQWSLRKPVYGLCRAPREWHDTLRTTLAALRFAPSTADPSLFLRTDTSLLPFYVLVYVLQRFGFLFSSPQPTPLSTGHSLSAPPSDESVEPSGPYPKLVGCLMYLMTCTRPDLAYPLSLLARYVAPGRHRKVHWDAKKRALRYLCSTSGMGLVLGGQGPVVLTGHADASWVDDSATQRSTRSQGYTFSLGSGSISWRSTRSSSVLSSSCEAELYAGAMAAQELRWLTYLLTDLGEQPHSPPVLYVDNKAMIALCQEHILEHRTKHIALRYFLARELQQRGQLRLAYVATRANTADIFTKALLPACFAFLDWSCDHLFSPTLPMGVCQNVIMLTVV
ncbi:unnamed protein product [Closterium sp. NIES-53]